RDVSRPVGGRHAPRITRIRRISTNKAEDRSARYAPTLAPSLFVCIRVIRGAWPPPAPALAYQDRLRAAVTGSAVDAVPQAALAEVVVQPLGVFGVARRSGEGERGEVLEAGRLSQDLDAFLVELRAVDAQVAEPPQQGHLRQRLVNLVLTFQADVQGVQAGEA